MFKSSNVSHTFSKTHVFFVKFPSSPAQNQPHTPINSFMFPIKLSCANRRFRRLHSTRQQYSVQGQVWMVTPTIPQETPQMFLGVDGSPQSSKLTKPWSLIFFCRLFCFRLRIFFKRTCVCLCIHCERHVLGGFREIPDGHAYELPRTSKNQRGVYTFFFEF